MPVIKFLKEKQHNRTKPPDCKINTNKITKKLDNV